MTTYRLAIAMAVSYMYLNYLSTDMYSSYKNLKVSFAMKNSIIIIISGKLFNNST